MAGSAVYNAADPAEALALIDAGDEVLMPDPSYPRNRQFVSAADGRAVRIVEDTVPREALAAALGDARAASERRMDVRTRPDGVTVINEAATYVGRGAMLVFGLDELARGVNPFRRLLGVAVLAWQLSAIVEAGFV